MPGRIHLIRHAESQHNVDKNFSRLDPGLTQLGNQQASSLNTTFPFSKDIGIVISSPLKRTIQTSLLAFSSVLDKRYFVDGEGGVKGGVELLLDPLLQERSAEPCDTGSEIEVLEKEFPGVEFGGLEERWRSKDGVFGVGDEAVERRAQRVRDGLKERLKQLEGGDKKDVVVVTHGVFMKFLSGDQGIDLPKAGWKSFEIGVGRDRRVVLVPV